MLYRHKDLIKIYKNDYQINKLIINNKIIKRDDGLYSDEKNESFTDVVAIRYPNAVITGLTAYYCYKLLDYNPAMLHVSSPRNSTKIIDTNIKQHFTSENIHNLGIVSLGISSNSIKIFNKEKLLIELFRLKGKISDRDYNYVYNNFNKIKKQLNKDLIYNYLKKYPFNGKLYKQIEDFLINE